MEEDVGPGATGLTNMDMTCYANSVVQALASLSSFRESVMSGEAALRCGRTHGDRGSDDAQRAMSRYGVRKSAGGKGAAGSKLGKVPKMQLEPPRVRTRNGRRGAGAAAAGGGFGGGGRGTLCGELRALFRDMRSGDYEVIPPVDLLREVFLHMDTFRQGQQQDAHEFIRLLLERLRRELCGAMKQAGGADAGASARRGGLPAVSPPLSAPHGAAPADRAAAAAQAGTKRRLIVGGGGGGAGARPQENGGPKRARPDGGGDAGGGGEDSDEAGYMVVSRWGYVRHKPRCQCRPCTSRRARERRCGPVDGDPGDGGAEPAPAGRPPPTIDLTMMEDGDGPEAGPPPCPPAHGNGVADAGPHARFVHSPALSEASPLSMPIDPISRVFGGALINRVVCHGCRHASVRYETFLDLSLCIPEAAQEAPTGKVGRPRRKAAGDGVSISELLEHFTRTELLNTPPAAGAAGDGGDGMYFRCARCGSATAAAEKRVEICALPEVLCLHLKRFSWVPSASAAAVGGKIDRHVEFPVTELDMAPYMAGRRAAPPERPPGGAPPAAAGTPGAGADGDGRSTEYDLAAVIAHSGKSINSGHYIAMVFHPESGAWLEFNDAKVRVVQRAYVEQQSAYILFYKRRDARRPK